MNALVITVWAKVRNSYWFVPSLMVAAAFFLSFVTTTVDRQLGAQWMHDVDWLYANQPAGARAVLSTVAGSMITVAGVTFSMTMLSISQTTSQVGPRLLNNFMADKGNQFTLGVFISTFIYCLLVLRTVRNGDTGPEGQLNSNAAIAPFVPHIAVLVGVLMAICSVGVLIYFIHHVPETIHVSNIIAAVGRGLNQRIDDQFPLRVGQPHQQPDDRREQADLNDAFYAASSPVKSTGVGYVEYVDAEGLMQIAAEHDVVILVQIKPGDFVTRQSVLLLVSPGHRLDDSALHKIAGMFIHGPQRTTTQDLRFQVNQLVEVAMRALSPGVNDPFTAISCMDWLQSALENLSTRQLPDAYRFDDQHKLRLVAEPVTFEAFAALVFDQLRPYVATDRNAALKMMEMLGSIALNVQSDRDRRLLVRHACALRRECRRSLPDNRAMRDLSARYRQTLRAVFLEKI
jgi:uncharacterized membrane protein